MNAARLATVVALAAAALAQPAAAGTGCYGERSVYYVCLTTPDLRVGDETLCVYAGGESCDKVTVPSVERDGGFGVECFATHPVFQQVAVSVADPCVTADQVLGGIR